MKAKCACCSDRKKVTVVPRLWRGSKCGAGILRISFGHAYLQRNLEMGKFRTYRWPLTAVASVISFHEEQHAASPVDVVAEVQLRCRRLALLMHEASRPTKSSLSLVFPDSNKPACHAYTTILNIYYGFDLKHVHTVEHHLARAWNTCYYYSLTRTRISSVVP